MMEALVITRREIRDSLRDWRIVAPIVILSLVFPYIMQMSASMATRMSNGSDLSPATFIPLALLLVGFFPLSISLVIALEAFVGEKERNSLEPLFASPLSDASLYAGKLLAALLLPLFSSYMGMAAFLGTLYLSTHHTVTPLLLLQIVLLTTIEGVMMVAGAVVISAHTASVRAANLLASFIVIPMIFVLQLEALLVFWGQDAALWFIGAALVTVDVLLLRMGVATFNREAILARDVDEVKVSKLSRQFRVNLLGEGRFTLTRLYFSDLPALLRATRVPLLATLGVVLLALSVGTYLAVRFPLPAGVISPANVSPGLEQAPSFTGNQFLPGLDAGGILVHNVRTLILGTFLGAVSFGSASLLVLAAPIGLIGFFTAQFAHAGINPLLFLAAFILPHGILEIPAAVLATTFSLRLGASLTAQSDGRPAGEHFMQAFAEWIKVFAFLVFPMLVVAAVVEANITPLIVLHVFGG